MRKGHYLQKMMQKEGQRGDIFVTFAQNVLEWKQSTGQICRSGIVEPTTTSDAITETESGDDWRSVRPKPCTSTWPPPASTTDRRLSKGSKPLEAKMEKSGYSVAT